VHFQKNPEKLTDEEWARLYQDYQYYRHLEYTNFKNAITKVLQEAFGESTEDNE
jgi:hypothetical protein